MVYVNSLCVLLFIRTRIHIADTGGKLTGETIDVYVLEDVVNVNRGSL